MSSSTPDNSVSKLPLFLSSRGKPYTCVAFKVLEKVESKLNYLVIYDGFLLLYI